jgi:hypothetical protein
MKILTVCVIAAIAASAIGTASAADAGKAVVNRDFTDTIAPAQQVAYEAGEKAWNQCLKEHGVKFGVMAYNHETGNTYTYSYVMGPITWADLDSSRNQFKACDATWRSQGNPHLKGETSAFMVDQPDMSHMPADWTSQAPPALISVMYFTLKPGHEAHTAFADAAKKIAAAADKAKWPYYFRFMQIQGGDEGAPDYILAMPNNSWADYGSEANPSMWKMVEGVYGKADTDALRETVNNAIEKASEHVDSYNADLSYIPGK